FSCCSANEHWHSCPLVRAVVTDRDSWADRCQFAAENVLGLGSPLNTYVKSPYHQSPGRVFPWRAMWSGSVQFRVSLRRNEHQETLQSHRLLPVTLNGRGPFAFAVEPSRSRTLVTANTIENLGVRFDPLADTVHVHGKLAYPLLR